MCGHQEYEQCSECGKEYEKDLGSCIFPAFPKCDLCPQIEDLEFDIEDAAFDIANSEPGPIRAGLFGKLMALQLRLSELKTKRDSRL